MFQSLHERGQQATYCAGSHGHGMRLRSGCRLFGIWFPQNLNPGFTSNLHLLFLTGSQYSHVWAMLRLVAQACLPGVVSLLGARPAQLQLSALRGGFGAQKPVKVQPFSKLSTARKV